MPHWEQYHQIIIISLKVYLPEINFGLNLTPKLSFVFLVRKKNKGCATGSALRWWKDTAAETRSGVRIWGFGVNSSSVHLLLIQTSHHARSPCALKMKRNMGRFIHCKSLTFRALSRKHTQLRLLKFLMKMLYLQNHETLTLTSHFLPLTYLNWHKLMCLHTPQGLWGIQ